MSASTRAEEDRRGEVDQPLHGGVRADRQAGDLRRFRRAAARATTARCPIHTVQRPIWPLDENASPGLDFLASLDKRAAVAYFVHGEFTSQGKHEIRLLASLLALVLPLSGAMAQDKVLRAVMHADVRVIDPIWTTQTIANIHGALVYDTLFGNDADQKPQPQMVGKYEISPDRLTYTFTLRDGLKFHDGSPVTTKDVIASLKRWGAKDGVGQRLMGYVVKMEAVDDKTFTHGAERALRHGAGIARQERQLDRRHHAREGCAHRSAAAGQGVDRLRPLHLRQGPVGAGQQGGLSQEQGLRAAHASRRRPSPAARFPASTASSWSGSPIRRRRCRR